MKVFYTDYDAEKAYNGTALRIEGEESDIVGTIPESDDELIIDTLGNCTTSIDFIEYRYTNVDTWFQNIENLTSVTLFGSEIRTIAPNAFFGCFSLAFVGFPDTLECIGDNAFAKCFSLGGSDRGLKLPKSLKRIGRNAFKECYALTEITVPKDCIVEGEENGYLEIGSLYSEKVGNVRVSSPIFIKVNRY